MIGYLLAGILLLILQMISGISWFAEFNLIFWPLLLLMYGLYPYTSSQTGWQKVLSWLALFAAGFTTYLIAQWGMLSADIIGRFIGALVISMFIGLDFGGVAPTTKSDLDPLLARLGLSSRGTAHRLENNGIRLILNMVSINLDGSKCNGCGVCRDICPMGVYRMDDQLNKSKMNRPSDCTACTACIVQCPTGALTLV